MSKISLPGLRRKLWKLTSEFVRRRDRGRCFTCGKVADWKEMHAGHFHDKAICNPELYYHLKNIHCQCPGCNLYRSGNKAIYATKLVEKYGDGILTELWEIKQRPVKWTRPEYEEGIESLKHRMKFLGWQ